MDFIIGWIDDDETVHIYDMFAQAVRSGCEEYGKCNVVDDQQDVFVASAIANAKEGRYSWRNESGVGLHFVRKMDTFDTEQDSRIGRGEVEILFASGSTIPSSVEHVNDEEHIHCYECNSPLYPGCDKGHCPLQGEVGYVSRSMGYKVMFVDILAEEIPRCDEVITKLYL